MTIRSFALVTLVMVMGSATGCSGTKNFLFGRGARCGLGSRGVANPYAPAQPAAPGCGLFPRCGLLNRNPAPAYAAPGGCAPPVTCAPAAGYGPPASYAPLATCPDNYQGGYVGNGCVEGGYSAGMAGDCECNSSGGGVQYQGGVVDPYLGSGLNQGGYPVDGSYPMDGGYSGGGVIQGDSFQPRTYQSNRVDSRGDRIISEEPLPPGARIVN